MFTLFTYPRIWRRWRTRADRTRSLQTCLAALLAFVLLASGVAPALAQDDDPDEPTRRRVPSIQIERTPTPEADDEEAEEAEETDADPDTEAETDEETESAEAETEDTPAGEPADTLEAAQAAVVQIEAVGTFVDPAEGLLQNAAGSGSGFIIDPSGIAVTNNHVVTGAAFVKVYIGGEERPRSARVLGVSECSDLAVIDIEGGGFPYLGWYDGRIRVGLDVYAAGFPLGDPEFTLTRGIVAKANADGESEWSSLPSVLQHDATINPGNSGGPLLDGDGRVVGVNYAGDDGTSQYFAISRDQALPLVEQLEAGNDVDSIGINGTAVTDGEELSGIWVASVDSGSPADNAGVQAGDIILSMEGLSLATDGTMSDYCNILRSHDREDVMSLRVLRYDSGEVFVGQLNGRELELSYTFGDIENTVEEEAAQNAGDEVDEGVGDEELVGYDEYVSVTDDSGRLAMDVPAAWSDVDGSEWMSDGDPVGVRLSAATDLEGYTESWGISGAFFGLIDLENGLELEEYLDGITFEESCSFDGREPFANDTYAGFSDLWLDCGEQESALLVLALLPETDDHVVYLEIGIATQADLDAADVILNSFSVDGLGGTPVDEGGETEVEVEVETGVPNLFELVDTSEMIYDFAAIEEPTIGALLPAAWGDVQVDDWVLDEDEGAIGYEIYVAADADAFATQWDEPGIWVRTSSALATELSVVEVLDVRYDDLAEQCEYEDRADYENTLGDTTYVGGYDIWYECGDSDNVYVVLVATPEAGNVLSIIEMQLMDDADLEAFEVLLATFYVPEATNFTADATASTTSTSAQSQPGSGDFVTVEDDDGVLSVSVPSSWADTESGAWLTDDDPEPLGLQLTVSPDILGFEDESEWIAPGAYVIASNLIPSAFELSEVLDLVEMSDSCNYDDRFDYERPGFSGEYDLWTDCDDQGVVIAWLAARPDNHPDIALLIMVAMLTDEDYDAFEQIINTVEYSEPNNFNALLDELAAAEIERAGSANELDEATAGSEPVAVVLVNALNVRAGPGTNYERVDSVTLNDQLLIAGRNEACSWLQVLTPSGRDGWVSASADFVTFTTLCRDIPVVDAPAASGSSGATGNTASGSSGNAAVAGDATDSTVGNVDSNTGVGTGGSTDVVSTANASQGCYLFQNQLGAEITITFTAQDRDWNNTFRLGVDAEQEQCFDPGRYTYTLDAPPPWNSVNDSMTIAAGDNYFFPIGAE